MIGEVAFKGFCRHAADGLPVRALFITPNTAALHEQQIEMMNMAQARQLDTIFYKSTRKLEVGPGVACLRVAHPHLDRELAGLDWHFIHGLEYLLPHDPDGVMEAALILRVQL